MISIVQLDLMGTVLKFGVKAVYVLFRLHSVHKKSANLSDYENECFGFLSILIADKLYIMYDKWAKTLLFRRWE